MMTGYSSRIVMAVLPVLFLGMSVFAGTANAQATDEVMSSGPMPAQSDGFIGRDYYAHPEFTWKAGQGPVKMISTFEGFCFLSGLRGPMDSNSDRVRIYVEGENWFIGGSATSPDLVAGARCIRLDEITDN